MYILVNIDNTIANIKQIANSVDIIYTTARPIVIAFVTVRWLEINNFPSREDSEVAVETLEVIENELAQPKPRKGFLRTALAGLQTIKGTAEFGAAVVALVQFIQAVL
jgi:hypothetical protein